MGNSHVTEGHDDIQVHAFRYTDWEGRGNATHGGRESTVLVWKDFGKIGLPETLGVSPWVIIPFFWAGTISLFFWFEKKDSNLGKQDRTMVSTGRLPTNDDTNAVRHMNSLLEKKGEQR